MMRRSVRLICLFLFLGAGFAVSPDSVFACSGPRSIDYVVDHLSYADIIVYATVVDGDDLGNAILHVHRYYKGIGNDYIVLENRSPATHNAYSIRGYSAGCGSGSRGRGDWRLGIPGYYALQDNGDGTYSSSNITYRSSPYFYAVNGRVSFNRLIEHRETVEDIMSEEDFQAMLLEVGKRTRAVEPPQGRMPLMRSLILTTENGTRYRINPDRAVFPLAPNIDPLAISEDGAHVAFRVDEATIGFQYLYHERVDLVRGYMDVSFYPVAGQNLLFSPDSSTVVVWNAEGISVYQFHSSAWGDMSIQTIAQAELVLDEAIQKANVAWSGNSDVLAYQDAQGIWTWNLFHDPAPVLAISADALDGASLLDVSATGRYLRYGDPQTWILLESESGETFANAIATPDERNLIYINAPDTDFLAVTWGGTYPECQPPLRETCPILLPRTDFQQLFWYEDSRIILVSCGNDRWENWRCISHHATWQVEVADVSYSYPIVDVEQVAYDQSFDQFAVITGDYRIDFDLYHRNIDTPTGEPFVPDALNLEGHIDSPIASIEWDQPIFYRAS